MLLGACGGGGSTNVKPTLKFADRSDSEIAALINAAGGTAMFSAQSQLDQFAGTTDPCPAVAVAGSTITLTGGCTTTGGVMFGGTASVTNSPAWDQITYNPANDTTYELMAVSFTQSGLATNYDGRVTISGNYTTYDADITSNLLGIDTRSDLHYECDRGSQTCDLSGSGIELLGVGGALVGGSVTIAGGATSSSFTLRGVDTVTAHVTQGCVEWSISGTQRAHACM
ncbi:MAG: hypothetical protein JO257_21815 [Deltaproteobacteria bacterium]|nr:hypothetical protein [Deltaproteobacteria bacterium]